MKSYCLLLALLLTGGICHAQLLKKVGNKVKEEVEWRAQRKAGQKIDQGLDSLLAVPGKVVKKKGSKKETTDMLDAKMGELKKQVDGVLLLYKDLSKANKEIGLLVRKGKKLPPNLAGNLSALNDDLADQASQLKKINEMADHKPQDNSNCS